MLLGLGLSPAQSSHQLPIQGLAPRCIVATGHHVLVQHDRVLQLKSPGGKQCVSCIRTDLAQLSFSQSTHFQPVDCLAGGSRAVRTAALRALRKLLEAAGPGDALAFVVPGVSTGLAKALTAAGQL